MGWLVSLWDWSKGHRASTASDLQPHTTNSTQCNAYPCLKTPIGSPSYNLLVLLGSCSFASWLHMFHWSTQILYLQNISSIRLSSRTCFQACPSGTQEPRIHPRYMTMAELMRDGNFSIRKWKWRFIQLQGWSLSRCDCCLQPLLGLILQRILHQRMLPYVPLKHPGIA